MAHFHKLPKIEDFKDINKITDVKDRAVVAASMFVYAVPRPTVLAICLAGESKWLKTCKQINAYADYKFQKADLKAVFRMICEEVADDLNATARNVSVHA